MFEQVFGTEEAIRCSNYQKNGQVEAKEKACNSRETQSCFEFCELNAEQFLESTPFTYHSDRAKGVIN